MLYEFFCKDCRKGFELNYPMKEAPSIGSATECILCGGEAYRLISKPELRPEFFGYTINNAGETPTHISTRRELERFRRDEFINATQGTHLEGNNGKLEYADKYMKQDMQKKQKERQVKREKALKDSYQKAEWKAREK